MEAIANDIIGLICAVFALVVVYFETQDYLFCKGKPFRWTSLFRAFVGLYSMGILLYTVFNNNVSLDGHIPTIPGRIMLILLLAGMSLSSMLQRKKGCV